MGAGQEWSEFRMELKTLSLTNYQSSHLKRSDCGGVMMKKKWHSVWEPGVPKIFEPEKPLTEYLRANAMDQILSLLAFTGMT